MFIEVSCMGASTVELSAAPGLSTDTLLTDYRGLERRVAPGEYVVDDPLILYKPPAPDADHGSWIQLISDADTWHNRGSRVYVPFRQFGVEQTGAGLAGAGVICRVRCRDTIACKSRAREFANPGNHHAVIRVPGTQGDEARFWTYKGAAEGMYEAGSK